MPVRYHAVLDRTFLLRRFGVAPTAVSGSEVVNTGEVGLFLRRPRAATDVRGRVPTLEATTGRWGLIPLFSPDGNDRATHEAASETAATERNFHQPWKRGHRCVVVVNETFEAVDARTTVRIFRADGQPFCIAGLWNGWRSPAGECVESFAMLTTDASHDTLMCQLPGKRPKRRPVVLPDAWVDDWFRAPVEEAAAFLQPYPPQALIAEALPMPSGR